MKITGKKIEIKKSAAEVYGFLSSVKNYKQFLPSSVQVAENGNDDELRFSLMGMSEVVLKINAQSNDNRIVLESLQGKHPFSLVLNLVPVGENSSEFSVGFEGSFNPLISMVAEKALPKLVDSMTEKIGEYFNR